ncbi:MAG: GspE/PulE family protein [Elusimicrobiota bacterium]
MFKQNPINKKIGSIITDLGIITERQLNKALDEQKISGNKIGKILVEKGLVSESLLTALLGKQKGIGFVDINEIKEISDEALGSISRSIARHYGFIPVKTDKKSIVIACSGNLGPDIIDKLRLITGKEIEVVIAMEEQIREALDKYYPSYRDENQKKLISVDPFDPRNPAAKILNIIIIDALSHRATCIHLEPFFDRVRVRYRIDGILHEVDKYSGKLTKGVLSKIKELLNFKPADSFPKEKEIETYDKGIGKKVAISLLPTVHGEKFVVKLNSKIRENIVFPLLRLGFENESLEKYKNNLHKGGIIVITGQAKNGKTTSYYSTLSYLNSSDKNIISVENNIKHQIEGITQINMKDEKEFEEYIFLQDPDIIGFDEIINEYGANLAVKASTKGCLVISVVQGMDAADAIYKLISAGIDKYLFITQLNLIINQRLTRKICEDCREKYRVDEDFAKDIGVVSREIESFSENYPEYYFYRGRGCKECNNIGYKGRLGSFGVTEMTADLKEMMLNGSPRKDIREKIVSNGNWTLRDSLSTKLLAGITSAEEFINIPAL